MNIIQEFNERGLLKDCSNLEALQELFDKEKVTMYCGFDPTADSLHVGSLLPIVTMVRFKNSGNNPLLLVGGATGLIGDPSFKAKERKLNTEETVVEFKNAIERQLFNLTNLKIVDNISWTQNLSVIDFLRDFGKHFTVNNMMARSSVKSRLQRDGDGISFTEFTYSVLQAMDFEHLFMNENCKLQIGGSDQWGNMTAGIELIGKRHGSEVSKNAHCLTIPLITKSDGEKFGKTESGTVWLSSEKTTPFEFFQFWLNVADADVIRFIKLFTFIPLNEIKAMEDEFNLSGGNPKFQRILAKEMTSFVHGIEVTNKICDISEKLFSKTFEVSDLSKDELEFVFSNKMMPTFELKKDDLLVEDFLIKTELASSKRQAREFLSNSAIKINGISNLDPKTNVSDIETLFSKFLVIKRGKNKMAIVKF